MYNFRIFLSFVFALFLTSCGSLEVPQQGEQPINVSEAREMSETSEVNDTPKTSDLNESLQSDVAADVVMDENQKTVPVPIIIDFDPNIYFDFDKSVIKSSEASKILSQVQAIQNSNPSSVTIEGHTDTIGTEEYNIALGERRAFATKKALVKSGVPEEIIDTVSYGERRLLDFSNTSEGHAKNRRTVTVLND